jgi:probable rRNA maturation factor
MGKVKFYFEDYKRFRIYRNMISENLQEIITLEGYISGNVSLIFCSDNYLLEMNKQFLDHDYFTDIITFNYSIDKTISGDLFISIDRVKENALNYNQTFENELYRVIFHGVLHLIGYDDKDEISVKIMKEKENYYLKKFEGKNDRFIAGI